jgi:hypothetical protein
MTRVPTNVPPLAVLKGVGLPKSGRLSYNLRRTPDISMCELKSFFSLRHGVDHPRSGTDVPGLPARCGGNVCWVSGPWCWALVMRFLCKASAKSKQSEGNHCSDDKGSSIARGCKLSGLSVCPKHVRLCLKVNDRNWMGRHCASRSRGF